MEQFFYADEKQLSREKAKAKELRNSAWWKRKKSSGVCHYCGRKFPPSTLTMDHVVPLARGGRSVKENLVPCCKECNNKKKNMLTVEWVEYLDGLKKQNLSSQETEPQREISGENNGEIAKDE